MYDARSMSYTHLNVQDLDRFEKVSCLDRMLANSVSSYCIAPDCVLLAHCLSLR